MEGTGREVDRLGGLIGSKADERLMGPGATEAAVKRLSADGTLAKYRYIHFACHGVLGTGDGVQPGLVLSQVGNPEGQDGYLRLDEVTDLRLNADLVSLSACQTGQGKVFRAEGVSGLARAFLYAGSRGVLCSLWQVDDEATADLMADLYTNLKAGQSSGERLRGGFGTRPLRCTRRHAGGCHRERQPSDVVFLDFAGRHRRHHDRVRIQVAVVGHRGRQGGVTVNGFQEPNRLGGAHGMTRRDQKPGEQHQHSAPVVFDAH